MSKFPLESSDQNLETPQNGNYQSMSYAGQQCTLYTCYQILAGYISFSLIVRFLFDIPFTCCQSSANPLYSEPIKSIKNYQLSTMKFAASGIFPLKKNKVIPLVARHEVW